MKKLIAIMLTLAMAISLLPATFAAEKNTIVYDNTLEYVFNSGVYGETDSISVTGDDGVMTRDASTVLSEKSDAWQLWTVYSNSGRLKEEGNGLYWNHYLSNTVSGTNAIAVKLEISRSGKYIPSLTYKAMPGSMIADVYITKKTEEDDTQGYKGVNLTSVSDARAAFRERINAISADKIGTIDMYSAETETKTVTFDEITIADGNEGDYMLFIVSGGVNENQSPLVSGTKKYAETEIYSIALNENTSDAAINNGVLEYITGTDILNTDKMYIHGGSDSSTEGIRSTGIVAYWPYVDWKKTSTLGPEQATVDAYPTMNLRNTDPWKMDSTLTSSGTISGFISSRLQASTGDGLNGTMIRNKFYNESTLEPGTSRPYFAIRINIPYEGKYAMQFKGKKVLQGAVTDVRFGKATSEERLERDTAVELEKIGKYYCNTTPADGDEEVSSKVTGTDTSYSYSEGINVEVAGAGEYWIVFDTGKDSFDANPYCVSHNSGNYNSFYLSGIKLTPIDEDYVAAFDVSGTAELKVGDTAVLTATATYADAGATVLASGVTYESSNPSVADVSEDGTVTAAMAGTALISATLDATGNTSSYWVTVDAQEAESTVSYIVRASDSTLNGAVSVEDNEDYTAGKTAAAILGETVTAVAEPTYQVGDKTYQFAYWQLANGDFVSREASYGHIATTNFTLEAVYDDITEGAEQIAELYKDNGEYIGRGTVTNGILETPAQPTLTGYVFSKWITDSTEEAFDFTQQLTAPITRLVARFVKDETTKHAFTASQFYTTVDSEKVYTYDGDYSYDTPVTLSHNSAKHWTRNGSVVAYGTEYTHYIWAETEIEYSNAAVDQVPLVYLDPTAKDGARMIEYDAAGKTVIEAGIIFGAEDSSNKPTVTSYASKARATNKENHGQFTAIPGDENTRARGYLIYKDGTEYKIVYSD